MANYIEVKSKSTKTSLLVNTDKINYIMADVDGDAVLYLDSEIIGTSQSMKEISKALTKIDW